MEDGGSRSPEGICLWGLMLLWGPVVCSLFALQFLVDDVCYTKVVCNAAVLSIWKQQMMHTTRVSAEKVEQSPR